LTYLFYHKFLQYSLHILFNPSCHPGNPFGDKEAEQADQIRAILKSQGKPMRAYDVLIAAIAIQHHLIMVTANQHEFDRVIGLQTENWRQP